MTLGEVAPSSLPDRAKQDSHFVDFVASLEELLDQLDEQVSPQEMQTLQKCVVALLRNLQKRDADNERLDADIKQQAGVLKLLQAEVEKLKGELRSYKEDQSRAMLRQVAYTFDQVAREFVYGPDCQFMTIVDLAGFYQYQERSPGEADRYEQFCAFINQQGCGIDKLIAMLRPLRGACSEPAYGRPEELNSVTTQQLQEWAPECGVPQRSLEAVLPLLLLFTQPGKPLVLRSDASEVV